MTRRKARGPAGIGKRRAKALGRFLDAVEAHSETWPEVELYPLSEREWHFLDDLADQLRDWEGKVRISPRQDEWLRSIRRRLRAAGAEIPVDAWGLFYKPARARAAKSERAEPESPARPLPVLLTELRERAASGDALSEALLRLGTACAGQTREERNGV